MEQVLKVHGRTAMLPVTLELSPTKPPRMGRQKLPLLGHQATRNSLSCQGSACPPALVPVQIILARRQTLDEQHQRSILSKPRLTPISGVEKFRRLSRSPHSITSMRLTIRSPRLSYTAVTRITIAMRAGSFSKPCRPSATSMINSITTRLTLLMLSNIGQTQTDATRAILHGIAMVSKRGRLQRPP